MADNEAKVDHHLQPPPDRDNDFRMQANALVAEAEKKLSGGKGFLSGLFG